MEKSILSSVKPKFVFFSCLYFYFNFIFTPFYYLLLIFISANSLTNTCYLSFHCVPTFSTEIHQRINRYIAFINLWRGIFLSKHIVLVAFFTFNLVPRLRRRPRRHKHSHWCCSIKIARPLCHSHFTRSLSLHVPLFVPFFCCFLCVNIFQSPLNGDALIFRIPGPPTIAA